MQNAFNFDLPAISAILERPLNKVPRRLLGATFQVTVSASDLAALRATYECGTDGVIRARERGSAVLTVD